MQRRAEKFTPADVEIGKDNQNIPAERRQGSRFGKIFLLSDLMRVEPGYCAAKLTFES